MMLQKVGYSDDDTTKSTGPKETGTEAAAGEGSMIQRGSTMIHKLCKMGPGGVRSHHFWELCFWRAFGKPEVPEVTPKVHPYTEPSWDIEICAKAL